MLNVIPAPLCAKEREGKVSFGNRIKISGAFENTASYAKKMLACIEGGDDSEMVFIQDDSITKEGYRLCVDKGKITVFASDETGVFYALMTLAQLSGGESSVPCCEIEDKPRYAFRGFMLDSARHFWSVETVKDILTLWQGSK